MKVDLQEEKRLKALEYYEILDTAPEPVFDEITQLASQVIGTPIAVFTLVDESRQWFKSVVGLPIRETPRQIAFCHYTIQSNDLFIVEDSLEDERFTHNPLVISEPGIRFYAGTPLITKDGYRIGSLAVIDQSPKQLSSRQTEQLKMFGRLIMDQVELRIHQINQDRLLQVISENNREREIALSVAHLGIWKRNLTNNSFECSDIFRDIYQLPPEPEPVTYEELLAPCHPADTERLKKAIEQAQKSKEKQTVEFRIVTKHAEKLLHLIMQIDYWWDSQNNYQVLIGTVQDQTESKAMEQAIVESEEQHRILFEQNPVAMWVYDINTFRFIAVNKMAEHQYGYTQDEFKNMTIFDIRPQQDHKKLQEALRRLQSQKFTQAKWTHRKKNGDIITVEVTSQELNYQGKAARLVLASDVTESSILEAELEKERQFFKALLEHVMEGIVACNEEGILTIFNKATRGFHGLPEKPIPPEQWSEYYTLYREDGTPMPKEEIPLFRAYSGEKVRKAKLVIAPKSLPKRILDCSGEAIYSTDNKKLGAVIVMHDVTQVLELEENLRNAKKLEALGRFTGGISHDFNNLLTVIVGNIDLINDELHSEHVLKNAVSMVEKAAQKGVSLVKQLLAFSSHQHLAPMVFDINDLLPEYQSLLSQPLPHYISLELQLDQQPLTVELDKIQFESLLMNLIVNARDAISEPGVIRIETQAIELYPEAPEISDLSPGSYARITVTDTGKGIPADVIENIFEPFFTTKVKGQGTGLGLSTAYGFIRQSNGNMIAQSEPGKGTTIQIYIPLKKAARVKQEEKQNLSNRQGTEYILLVEDDELVRDYAQSQLMALGYQVKATGSSHQALEFLRSKERYDLLFTDVMIPGGLNGPQLADLAKSAQPRIKILYTSGYTGSELSEIDLTTSHTHFLAKPYNKMKLSKTLEAVFEDLDQSGASDK